MGSSCGKVVVDVAASDFRPAVMTERISKRSQVKQGSEHGREERMTGWKHSYDRDGEEREEVEYISFRLVPRVDHDAVEPPPPRPRMRPQ